MSRRFTGATSGGVSTSFGSAADHSDFTLPAGDWAIAVTLRPQSSIPARSIVFEAGRWYALPGYYLEMRTLGYKFGMGVSEADEASLTTATAPAVGTAVSLIIERASNVLRIYRNGTSDAGTVNVSAIGALNITTDIAFGIAADGHDDLPFNGDIADWRLFHRALTANERTAYVAGDASHADFPDNPVVCYTFNALDGNANGSELNTGSGGAGALDITGAAATADSWDPITNEGGGADTTAPTLSSPSASSTGSTTGSGSVSTDEGNGTLSWVVTTSSTSPSAAQVRAGQDHTGAAAVDSGSQAVSGTGVQNVSGGFTGLTAETTYYAHYQHRDSSNNDSSVSSSSSFTTDEEEEPGSFLAAWALGSNIVM